jgi:hypothetical protein
LKPDNLKPDDLRPDDLRDVAFLAVQTLIELGGNWGRNYFDL